MKSRKLFIVFLGVILGAILAVGCSGELLNLVEGQKEVVATDEVEIEDVVADEDKTENEPPFVTEVDRPRPLRDAPQFPTFDILFSEEMDPDSITTERFLVAREDGTKEIFGTLTPNKDRVLFILNENLDSRENYKLIVRKEVKDLEDANMNKDYEETFYFQGPAKIYSDAETVGSPGDAGPEEPRSTEDEGEPAP